jgi:16S rRNA (guanine966-N2)-methyltransferase
MSDRIRGALFNTLGDIAGLTVLDAFAGSGALSFEAVSRGATQATLIEPDKSAQRAIADSITELKISDQARLIRAKAGSWLSTSTENFDIILCDPPYDSIDERLLEKLATRAKPGGTIVYSLPPNSSFQLPRDYKLLSSKSYGDATLNFWRRQA